MSASLPALSPGADTRSIVERVNRLIREQNRIEVDTFAPVYAADTGTGTAYAMAPLPGIEQYVEGQVFAFKASNANSGAAPTLAVNGLAAGTIVLPGGGALSAREIPAGGIVQVEVASISGGTPTFHLLNPRAPTGSSVESVMAADIQLAVQNTVYTLCNTGAIGAAGQVWLLIGVMMVNSTTTDYYIPDIYSSTAAAPVTGSVLTSPAGANSPFVMTRIVTLTGATTFTLRCTNLSSANGWVRGGTSANYKPTTLTAVRLA